MATSPDFIDYIMERISGCGATRFRKMFGEYMVYVNEKPLFLVCDNCVYVKILPCLDNLMADAQKGFPYDGAKEHYVLDIDDAAFVRAVIAVLEPATPLPKPKNKKGRHPKF